MTHGGQTDQAARPVTADLRRARCDRRGRNRGDSRNHRLSSGLLSRIDLFPISDNVAAGAAKALRVGSRASEGVSRAPGAAIATR